MEQLILFTTSILLLISSIVNAPVPGKPVYVKQSNSLWVFSFSKTAPADNKLSFIDLNQSFNTLNPPVYVLSSQIIQTNKYINYSFFFIPTSICSIDISTQITNNQCPVMHFAQALHSYDGVSINVFGAGSDINGIYESTMALCQFNTQTNSWKQIIRPNNAPPARRNAAFEITQTGLTFIWGLLLYLKHITCFLITDITCITTPVILGGSSEIITGLNINQAGYPYYWHQDASIYDYNNGWVNGPIYSGPSRANATMTQIRLV
jgi:hypothetical protein